MFSLLPDQQEIVDNARRLVGGGCKSLLIQAATGSGKTVMASEIISGAYRKNKICFFVVPRKDLLRQTSETLAGFGIPHSFVASGVTTDTREKVFVCSAQTLVNRLYIVPDVAIIDETHYGGEALDKIVKFFRTHGSVVIGLSATPSRLDGRGLGCWYDDMIEGKSIRWLIDNNRLASYRPFAPDRPDLAGIKILAGDYAKGELSERMEQNKVLIGNSVKHYKTHAMGKLGITFAVSRKHSEMLAQAYRDAGIPAMHMDGETPDSERKRIAKAFAKRELLQLCNAELLTFGYDLSSASGIKGVNIQVMTDCQPTKSLAKQMQKWGRNLRYDLEPHLFFDHANNFHEHGFPCQERKWTLADRKKSKRDNDDEKTLPVRQCTQCYFCHKPAPVCPNCGYEYPIMSRKIEEVDGELAELKIQEQKKAARMEVGKARTVADLHRIANERGYAKGWVFKQMQLKGIRA